MLLFVICLVIFNQADLVHHLQLLITLTSLKPLVVL